MLIIWFSRLWHRFIKVDLVTEENFAFILLGSVVDYVNANLGM